MHGRWETWLEFFLEGIILSSRQAIKTAEDINHLFFDDAEKIAHLGRARFSCLQALDYLKQLPQISAPSLASALSISTPTARSALNHMVNLGILEEISDKKRDKVYLYRKYINILEDGAQPLPPHT